MSNLKVYFNPGIHPQFEEIYNYPPEGVDYIFNKPEGDHNSAKVRQKRFIISRLHRLGVPRMTYIKNSEKYDLIHSTRGLLVLNKKPWIVDIESGAAFVGLEWIYLKNSITQRIIRKQLSSKYCKFVLPQSNAAKQSMLDNINCRGFEDKIETLYLAYHTNKLERKDSDKIRLSFIGRDLYPKGGYLLQEAFKVLDKKYDVQLKLKGIVPPELRLNNPNIIYMDQRLDKDEFYNQIFGDCDIYVQPTMCDSYGVSILEAMSTGLPVVCTDDFTLPEMVEEGVNGFTVKTPVSWYEHLRRGAHEGYEKSIRLNHVDTVNELVKKLSTLIEDSSLRKKMGENSFKMVESGKFSIKERNKKLKEIYEKSLQ